MRRKLIKAHKQVANQITTTVQKGARTSEDGGVELSPREIADLKAAVTNLRHIAKEAVVLLKKKAH